MPAGNQVLGFADIERHLDDRTRLVTLSSAHFISGRPLRDLPEIGRELRRRGVLLCVDAIQSLGAQRLSAREVDFLVADGHKWLLAPKGMGILYVRSTAMSQLRPTLRGWRSMARPHDFSVQVELAGTARRYESGSLNEFGLVGLHAALKLLQTFGPDAVEERIRLLRQGLVSGLQERQALIVGQPGAPDWSGIISFRLAHEPAGETVRRLARAGVVVSLRQPSGGEPVVRVAPHFYNTESEIDRFFETLYAR
jgi:selenocysteine lyase/cysteine desulfurase